MAGGDGGGGGGYPAGSPVSPAAASFFCGPDSSRFIIGLPSSGVEGIMEKLLLIAITLSAFV